MTIRVGIPSLVGVFLTVCLPLCATAQLRQPDTVLALDLNWLGAGLSYARERGPGRYLGLGAGVGGALWNRMLLAGRHLAHEDGPSYEERDGATDQELIEILHVEVFRRWVSQGRWHADVGARASAFVHFNSFDDDPGVPLFLGAYGSFMVGSRRVKVGPRLLVGLFTEGSGVRELGIYLVPLTGRVSFGW